MIIEGNFPRQQSAPSIAKMLDTKCQCNSCREFYAERKRVISGELADIALLNAPYYERRREQLINELLTL